MDSEIKKELEEGNRLALALVDHLNRMGNASEAEIPVMDRHEEYVVMVIPKTRHKELKHERDQLRTELGKISNAYAELNSDWNRINAELELARKCVEVMPYSMLPLWDVEREMQNPKVFAAMQAIVAYNKWKEENGSPT